MSLRFDSQQRFTCASCARCCRGAEVAVTRAEVETLRASRAERFFREGESAAEGASSDPFLPIRGTSSCLRIRRRPDGTCGFLSPQNRCRLHEALGAKNKPLTCRMFPFAVLPGTSAGEVLVASYSCPTVAAGEGETLGSQAKELGRLAREWQRVHAPIPRPLELAAARALSPHAEQALRESLLSMLSRPDLRDALSRMAAHLADLTRWRVLRLSDQRRSEYVALTSTFRGAPEAVKPELRRSGLVSRLLFLGFLYAVLGVRERRLTPGGWGQRRRMVGLLLHVHGLLPGLAGVRLGAVRGVQVPAGDPAIVALLRRFLTQAVETLAGGSRPIAEELAFAAAQAQVALRLARMNAGLAGRTTVALDDLRQGLVSAADVGHADVSILARLLSVLAGPPDEALERLAAELS